MAAANGHPAHLAHPSNTGDLLEALTGQLTQAVAEYKQNTTGDDFATRTKVMGIAAQLLYTAEKPEDQWLRQSISMADLGATRLFQKWKAFDAIPLEGSVSYKELAEKLNATESLVTRVAWVLVSLGTLKQIGDDQVAHTPKSTVYINNHPCGALFEVMFNEGLIPYTKMPEYFEKYGRKEAETQDHTPHTFGHGQPDKMVWEVIAQDPERMKTFMQCMSTLESHLPITGFYDFGWAAAAAAADPERVLLVDVGGGKGHAIRAITRENAFITPERCVLQDRADVIPEAEKIQEDGFGGVKKMVHDMNTEQPVKGALIYWIRRCIHDYSDADCATILRHLADAAAPDSRILVVEQIVQNPPPPLVAQTDFCMIAIGGKERTVKGFEALAKEAGLKLNSVSHAQGTPVGALEFVKA